MKTGLEDDITYYYYYNVTVMLAPTIGVQRGYFLTRENESAIESAIICIYSYYYNVRGEKKFFALIKNSSSKTISHNAAARKFVSNFITRPSNLYYLITRKRKTNTKYC